ncbi:MAG: hypothetical protein JWL97_4351 [Gemmatimonadales bacterium]|nr:hypothetical protein [Gemmatimonadales bacterium]
MSALIKYDQARQALAACRNVDDVKDIRDKSEAMRLYAKQANDTELEQWAAEIKLRAQRAIGEISLSMEKQKGGFGMLPTGGKHKAEALADAGISTSTANRYEKLAAIPEEAVEAFIAASKDAGKPVSAKAVLAKAAPQNAQAGGQSGPKTAETCMDTDFTPVVERGGSAPPGQIVHDDDAADMVRMAEELQRENEAYQRQIKSLEVDDKNAELVRLNTYADQLNGRLQGEITTRNEAQKMVKHYADLLAKIRKALNVESNRDILSALERK